MNSESIIIHLIQDPSFERWVRDNNAVDAAHWEKWLHEHPHLQDEVKQAQRIVKGISFNKYPFSSDQIEESWQQLAQRTTNTKHARRLWKLPEFRYAAAVSLLLLIGAGIWISYGLATTVTYETPFGQTRTLVLEDGTQVQLNANSVLSFDKNWLAQPQREVFLQGEAYFSVTQRTQKQNLMPFIVHTSDLSVRVLGTQFNVNSRRGQTQVVLNEGKVALRIEEADEETMEPGDFVEYSSEKNEMTRQQVNPEIYTSWRNQVLTLDDTPVGHVIQQLEDTYGVSFVLQNEEIRERKISSTGSITTQNLDTILEALSTLLQVNFERKSNTIHVYEN